jgi:hypothetical protein
VEWAVVKDYAAELIELREAYRSGCLPVAEYLDRSTAIWSEALAQGLSDALHEELTRRGGA